MTVNMLIYSPLVFPWQSWPWFGMHTRLLCTFHSSSTTLAGWHERGQVHFCRRWRGVLNNLYFCKHPLNQKQPPMPPRNSSQKHSLGVGKGSDASSWSHSGDSKFSIRERWQTDVPLYPPQLRFPVLRQRQSIWMHFLYRELKSLNHQSWAFILQLWEFTLKKK